MTLPLLRIKRTSRTKVSTCWIFWKTDYKFKFGRLRASDFRSTTVPNTVVLQYLHLWSSWSERRRIWKFWDCWRMVETYCWKKTFINCSKKLRNGFVFDIHSIYSNHVGGAIIELEICLFGFVFNLPATLYNFTTMNCQYFHIVILWIISYF